MNKKSKREAKMIAKANRFINRKPPESREADDTPSTDTLNEWYGDEVWDCELCRGSGCEEIEFCVDDVTTEKIKIQCRMCKGKKIHTDEDYAAFQSRDPALDVIVSLDPNWKVLEESR